MIGPKPKTARMMAANNVAMGLYLMALTWLGAHSSVRAGFEDLMRREYPLDYRIFQGAAVVLNHVDAVLLVVAAIGELRQRPWARSVTLGAAVYCILFASASIYFEYVGVGTWVKDMSDIIRDPFDQQSIRIMGRAEAFFQSLPSIIVMIVALLDGIGVLVYHKKTSVSAVP